METLLRDRRLHTVCESAGVQQGECFEQVRPFTSLDCPVALLQRGAGRPSLVTRTGPRRTRPPL
jgi:hypothetical protein